MFKSPQKYIQQADYLLHHPEDSAVLETLQEYKQELNFKNFRYFLRDAWGEFEPHEFENSWHIDCIAEHLQAQAEGNKDLQKLIISVPPRHCVYENERVYLVDGTFKYIKDINIGDKIVGVKNTLTRKKSSQLTIAKVLDKVYTGTKEVFKISLTNGKNITVTADHRLFTELDGKQSYTEMRNITKEHKLVCVHNYSRYFKDYQFKKPCIYKYDEKHKSELDFLAMYLLWGSKNSSAIIFSKSIRHRVDSNIIKDTFIYPLSKYKEILSRWKVDNYTKFPMGLFESTKELIGYFIGRLINGMKLENGKLQALQIIPTEKMNNKVTPIIIQLLDYIGIDSTVYYKTNVAILGFKDLKRYMRHSINPRYKKYISNPVKKTPTTKDIIYTEKIRRIECIGTLPTYDIETSSKNFICNGIISHNSKSTICSVMYPAWLWLRNPSEEIMTISSTNSLSLELNTKCKDLITSEWYLNYAYKYIGPDFALREDVNSKGQFRNLYGGNKFSTSILSKILGKGADTIIIDDPNDYGAGNSKDTTSFEQVIDAYKGRLISRQNRIADTKWLLIQQRVGKRDLTGYVLDNEDGWFQLLLPMEYEPTRTFISPINFNDKRREQGALLCPKRFPTNYVKALKTDPAKWSTMYQQDPKVTGGTEFKLEWLVMDKYIHTYPIDYYNHIIFSIDTAYTETKQSDYTVIVKLGIKDNKIFLLDMIREQLDFPKVLVLLKDVYEKNKSFYTKMLLEKGSAGTPVLQMLENTIPILEGIPIKNTDKEARFRYTFPIFMQRQVIIPDPTIPGNGWVNDVISELIEFPYSSHDDIVDALSQGIYYAKENYVKEFTIDNRVINKSSKTYNLFDQEINPFTNYSKEAKNIFI